MAWNAWGDPDLAKPLSAGIRSLLEQALGITGEETPPPGIEEVRLTPSALSEEHRAGLAAIVGEHHLRTGDRDRLLHAGGKSTPDLLRRREMQQDAPDAILLPVDFDEIRRCSRAFKTVIREIAPLMEDRGIDEVYIDFTEVPGGQREGGRVLARLIQRGILDATGLSCSIGVAPNKLSLPPCKI